MIGGAIVGSIAGARAGAQAGNRVGEVVEAKKEQLCENCKKLASDDNTETKPSSGDGSSGGWGSGGHRLGSG
jgi:hypothetical protein